MGPRQRPQRFDQGYRDGYAACLNAGSSAAVRLQFEVRTSGDDAYAAGVEWALYDYDDANGLRSVTHVGRLTRGRTAE